MGWLEDIFANAAGLGASALGKSGAQGGTTGTTTSTNTSLANTSQLQHMIEDPAFAQYRSSLMPVMTQAINKAQQPVYGDAQKGQFMSGLNDLTSSAVKSLSSSLASRGISDSGAAAEGFGGIEAQRLGKASDFYSQLPFQEAQAQADRLNPLLSMATNWAGRPPVDTSTTGTASTTSNASGTMSSTGQGQPWWKNVLSGVGDKMGDAAGAGKTGLDLIKAGLGLGGGAATAGLAGLPTFAGGSAAAGLTAAQMVPGAGLAGAFGGGGTSAAAAGTGAATSGGLSSALTGLSSIASWAAPAALFAKAFIHPIGFNRDEVRTPGSLVQGSNDGRAIDMNAKYWLDGKQLSPEEFKQQKGVYPWEIQLPDLGPGSVVDPTIYNTAKDLLGPGNWTPEELKAAIYGG